VPSDILSIKRKKMQDRKWWGEGGMQGEKGGRGGLSDQIYIQLSYCLGMHISLLQEL
jgi:hypothetical protein